MITSKHRISKESLRASGQVQSLSRALRLMNTLADYPKGLSLSEVAQSVALPTSTAHRLLTTLQNERYIRFDSDRSLWLIGVQAFRVGNAFMCSRDLATTARPYMKRLMQQSGETVHLGVIDSGGVIYTAQIESTKSIRSMAAPGDRVELHTSGAGKAILAFMDLDEREKFLNSMRLHPSVALLPKTLEVLRGELRIIRARGFAIDDEESAVGLRCVASVLFDEHRCPLGAVSVSGPTSRIPDEKMNKFGEAARDIAEEITRELGGSLPDRKSA